MLTITVAKAKTPGNAEFPRYLQHIHHTKGGDLNNTSVSGPRRDQTPAPYRVSTQLPATCPSYLAGLLTAQVLCEQQLASGLQTAATMRWLCSEIFASALAMIKCNATRGARRQMLPLQIRKCMHASPLFYHAMVPHYYASLV